MIRSAVNGASVEVSLSDTGADVSPESIENLFSPFVTTKSSGLGIGLTIARSIVEAHDGTIAAHANLDGGATFTITLPLRAASKRRVTPI